MIHFSELCQDPIPEFVSDSPSANLQSTQECVRRPLLIPHPSEGKQSAAPVSAQTLDLIKKIRTQGKESLADFVQNSPIPHLLSQQAKSQDDNCYKSPISNSTSGQLR